MRKIIMIVISMMMLMPSVANAQIKVTSKVSTERLLSIRMGFIELKYNGSYYLMMSTTNRFDDPIILLLGKDKEEAMQTLQSLIDITTSIKKGDCVTIQNASEELQIYRYAKNTISIYSEGRAGSANTNKSELTRCLDAVSFDVR